MSVSEAYLLTQFDTQYISVLMVPYGMVLLVPYLMAFYLMFVRFSDYFPDNLFLLAASFVPLYGNEAEAGWLLTSIEFLKCFKIIIPCLAVLANRFASNQLKSWETLILNSYVL